MEESVRQFFERFQEYLRELIPKIKGNYGQVHDGSSLLEIVLDEYWYHTDYEEFISGFFDIARNHSYDGFYRLICMMETELMQENKSTPVIEIFLC